MKIIPKAKDKVHVQDYSSKKKIEGVKIIKLKFFPGEDGTFEELARFKNGFLEEIPSFEIKQVSRAVLLPGAIKAWHLHYNQEDLWYVPPSSHLLVGLWDLREDSKTRDLKMKVVMGAHSSSLLYIPRGVGHGVANIGNKEGEIIYFVNQHFNAEKPDENRLPWDAAGLDFWQPKRE